MRKLHRLENEQNQISRQKKFQQEEGKSGFTTNKYDVQVQKIVSKKDKSGKIILVTSDYTKSEQSKNENIAFKSRVEGFYSQRNKEQEELDIIDALSEIKSKKEEEEEEEDIDIDPEELDDVMKDIMLSQLSKPKKFNHKNLATQNDKVEEEIEMSQSQS